MTLERHWNIAGTIATVGTGNHWGDQMGGTKVGTKNPRVDFRYSGFEDGEVHKTRRGPYRMARSMLVVHSM